MKFIVHRTKCKKNGIICIDKAILGFQTVSQKARSYAIYSCVPI